jgi:hypothetical protein
MYDVPSGFTEFSTEEIVYLKKENHAGATVLRHEMRALLNSRLARNITKDEFDQQRSVINEDLWARRQRVVALDAESLIRAHKSQ